MTVQAETPPAAHEGMDDELLLETYLEKAKTLYIDRSIPRLVELALQRGEGVLASNGAFTALTGERTGRSPKDRFLVDEPETSADIDWGAINQPFPEEAFDRLWERAVLSLADKDVFINHLFAGVHPDHTLSLRVITEYAWHALFARQLFIRPDPDLPLDGGEEWTILNVPSLTTDPERDGTHSDGVVIVHLSKRRILLCGLRYAGEMKKSVFSIMNYQLPKSDILPMHCAANVGEHGGVAVFFGLSGTGKTTLSADPARFLIGDDEHGWDEDGIFNFEGGCYAKCINLTLEREPVIWNAIRFGAIMENVVLDENSHEPDYDDSSITENTRVAYPRDFIEKRMPGNQGTHPDALIFLTCDLFGVLPPVARLTKEQAAYHFLSGYTALVGGTEIGQIESVKPTFSACFGAPFFPRAPKVYAELLMEKIEEHDTPVYLVSTGWTGGAYGEGGRRLSIATTRALIHAILRGDIEKSEMEHLSGLNLSIPKKVHGIDDQLLNPRNIWADKGAYDRYAEKLIKLFMDNFERFDVSHEIKAAGPVI